MAVRTSAALLLVLLLLVLLVAAQVAAQRQCCSGCCWLDGEDCGCDEGGSGALGLRLASAAP